MHFVISWIRLLFVVSVLLSNRVFSNAREQFFKKWLFSVLLFRAFDSNSTNTSYDWTLLVLRAVRTANTKEFRFCWTRMSLNEAKSNWTSDWPALLIGLHPSVQMSKNDSQFLTENDLESILLMKFRNYLELK